MANNVQFQSSSPSTPSSATIVETADQGGGVQRQKVSVADVFGSSAVITVTPSSNTTVAISGIPTVAVSSGTITPSSVLSVTPSSVVSVALSSGVTISSFTPSVTLSSASITQLSSNPTVILSSNPTVIPSSAIQVTLTSNVVAVSSGTITLSSNPTITSVSSGAVSIISGANTANVVAGSSTVTSTMSALVVAFSTLGPLSVSVSGSSIVAVSSGTITLSSNPTVIPSSAVQVTLTSNTVAISSGTVTLSSNVTVTPSSNFTVILSSNPTITSVSSGAVTIINGANTANVMAASSVPTSTMAALLVAISPNGTNANGQALMANSAPVVIASDQSTLTIKPSSNFTVILSSNPTVIPSSVFTVALSSIASIMGDVANVTTDSGNPVKIGGIYNSTNPTSASSGQRVQAWFDKSGKMIAVGALRALKGVQLTALSSSTTETNITPTSTGGNFIDIYGLVLANLSSANTQQVTIKDSSGGTSRMLIEVPFSDTRGFMLPVDSAIPQSGSSQAWTATLSNSSGGFQVTALYVTNV